jgi:hypothetical protein
MVMSDVAAVAGCSAQLAPTVASSSSPCVVGMGVRCLPVARGLRIGASRAKFSTPGSSHGAVRSQRRGIVCEAQETVTGGIHLPVPSSAEIPPCAGIHCPGVLSSHPHDLVYFFQRKVLLSRLVLN